MKSQLPHAAWSAAPLLTRREALGDASSALGLMAMAWMFQGERVHGGESEKERSVPGPHFEPKAKRAIHIFSPGGVSHVDTFDEKRELNRLHGMALTGKGELDPFMGKPGNLMRSVYRFRSYGECGKRISDLLPNIAKCADDLTFLHSLVTKSSSHTPACFQMNTGFTLNGFPSLGAWLSYGLGTANNELPTFVVLPDPRGLPNGGTNNWSQGFLPAQHQGTAFRTSGSEPIANLNTPSDVSAESRRAGMKLLAAMNRDFADQNPGDSALRARLESYELAAQMQASVPEAIDFSEETQATQEMYGLNDSVTAGFGRNCLLARRLLERGVRFVQLYNGGALGSPRINWDAHENLQRNHDNQAAPLDKPCAALLNDLKQRGMLKDTLVFWSSEFGRTPFTQGINGRGRDHHNLVFSAWMAGAGLKPGFSYGASDEVGYLPAENPATVYDFHATILHLLGIDHERLTYYHNGIQRRLTDVHGHVLHPILS